MGYNKKFSITCWLFSALCRHIILTPLLCASIYAQADSTIQNQERSDSTTTSSFVKQDALLDSITGDVQADLRGIYSADQTNSTASGTDSLTENDGLTFDLGLTRDYDFNVWPVFKYYQSMDKNELFIDAAVSLFRRSHNITKNEYHTHLIPLYWFDKKQDSQDYRLLSCYYPSFIRFGTDKQKDAFYFSFLELAPNIGAVNFMKSNDGLFMRNNLFFFLWHKFDRSADESYLVLFPFYWMYKNSHHSSLTLFPFFSRGTFDQNRSNYCAITPLFLHTSSASVTNNFILPLWWNHRSLMHGDTATTNLLLPVYWSFENTLQSNQVIFPLVWNLRNHY